VEGAFSTRSGLEGCVRGKGGALPGGKGIRRTAVRVYRYQGNAVRKKSCVLREKIRKKESGSYPTGPTIARDEGGFTRGTIQERHVNVYLTGEGQLRRKTARESHSRPAKTKSGKQDLCLSAWGRRNFEKGPVLSQRRLADNLYLMEKRGPCNWE